MKILLLYPPIFQRLTPYPSIYYIKGYLKSVGYSDVRDIDLSIRYYHYTFDNANAVLERAERSIADGECAYRDRGEELSRRVLESRGEIKRAVDYFSRNRRIRYDSMRAQKYEFVINSLLELDGLNNLLSIEEQASLYSSSGLIDYVSSEEYPYLQYYNEQISSLGSNYEPDFIGISLTYNRQVHHTIALSRLLKARYPSAHICVGGSMATRLAHSPRRTKHTYRNLFKYIDSIVCGEAEHSLAELIEYVGGKRATLPSYANVIMKGYSPRKVTRSPHAGTYLPDYSNIESDKYFCMRFGAYGYKALSYVASRGCSWRRCRYCTSHLIYSRYDRCDNMDRLVKSMRRYCDKYGIGLIRFNDEAMSPNVMMSLSKSILKNSLKVRWVTNIRVEKGFESISFKDIRRSGCRNVYIGLESGSQRILDLMDKGFEIGQAERLLKRLHNSGIGVAAYILNFFPGERPADVQRTHEFLKRNIRYLDGVGWHRFYGDMHAPIFEDVDVKDLYEIDEMYDLCLEFFQKKGASRKHELAYRGMVRDINRLLYDDEAHDVEDEDSSPRLMTAISISSKC